MPSGESCSCSTCYQERQDAIYNLMAIQHDHHVAADQACHNPHGYAHTTNHHRNSHHHRCHCIDCQIRRQHEAEEAAAAKKKKKEEEEAAVKKKADEEAAAAKKAEIVTKMIVHVPDAPARSSNISLKGKTPPPAPPAVPVLIASRAYHAPPKVCAMPGSWPPSQTHPSLAIPTAPPPAPPQQLQTPLPAMNIYLPSGAGVTVSSSCAGAVPPTPPDTPRLNPFGIPTTTGNPLHMVGSRGWEYIWCKYPNPGHWVAARRTDPNTVTLRYQAVNGVWKPI